MDNSQETPTQAPMPNVGATLKEENLPTHHIKPLYRITQVVWYLVGLIETLLLVRFLLKLFAANPTAGFTRFIYGVTSIFAAPFLFVFNVSQVQQNIFEWSTLLAMAVYFLLGWLIVKALVMSKPVSTKEADQKLPEQEKL